MARSTEAGDDDAGRRGGDVAVEGVRVGLKRMARHLGCSHHTVKGYMVAGGVKPFQSPERAKLLDGPEGWLREPFIQHRGNADVVRQDLLGAGQAVTPQLSGWGLLPPSCPARILLDPDRPLDFGRIHDLQTRLISAMPSTSEALLTSLDRKLFGVAPPSD